jgi:phage shock protein C
MQDTKANPKQNSDEVKKLYRSKIDRIFAGVCGGIAEYFNIDVTIIRVITLILFFFKGIGIFFYLICLIAMKENPEQSAADRKETQNTAIYWGIGLVLLGLSMIPHWRWNHWSFNPFGWHLFDPWFFDWDVFWPVIIILFGVLYLIHILRRGKEGDAIKKTTDKFCRSRSDKVIGGVCGGIATHLKIDPVIVRIGWVVLSLATKFLLGIIVYILCMIIFPEETIKSTVGPEKPIAPEPESKKTAKRVKKMPKKDDSGKK